MKKIIGFIIVLSLLLWSWFWFYSYKKQNQSTPETATKAPLNIEDTTKYFYKILPNWLWYQEYTPWELEEIYINWNLEKIKKSYRGYLITEEKNWNVWIIQVSNNKDISELSDNWETKKYNYEKILSFSWNLVYYETYNQNTSSWIENIAWIIEKNNSYSLFNNSNIIIKDYDNIEILGLKNDDIYYGAKKDNILHFYKNYDLLWTETLLEKYKDFYIDRYRSFAENKWLYLVVSFTRKNWEKVEVLLENFKAISPECNYMETRITNELNEWFFYICYKSWEEATIHLPKKTIPIKTNNNYFYRVDVGHKISKNWENVLIYMWTKDEFFPFYNWVQISEKEADKISAQMQ
jgi:hypothetical protein